MTTKITEKNISSIANTAVQWQSVHVADGSTALTTSAGKGYFIDTTSAAQTVNLPSVDDSTLGDTIVLKDFARKWDTNNVTIAANTFEGTSGASNTRTFSTKGQTVTLVFTTIANGWQLVNDDTVTGLGEEFIEATGGTITTSGNFKIHTFTGDGCFVVSSAGNSSGANKVSYMVIAGGGGGGRRNNADGGGGGGAGGFREGRAPDFDSYTASPLVAPDGLPVSVQTYPITVGAGGTGGTTTNGQDGTNGSNSVFSTITSAGGGVGGEGPGVGGSGGSGGGNAGGTAQVVASGNTPPVSPPQGNNGGLRSPSPDAASGGGGGAGAVGATASGSSGGNGGAGVASEITASSVTRAGGGGAGSAPGRPTSGGTAGSGGGADGDGGSGTANTGGGAGGSNGTSTNGGNGGKGVVIIRYKFQ